MSTTTIEKPHCAGPTEEAQAILSQIRAAMVEGRAAAWKLAAALYAFDECKCWGMLGYDTLEEWLPDPEIGMARRTFYRYVSTYRKLVVERRISLVDTIERRFSNASAPRELNEALVGVLAGLWCAFEPERQRLLVQFALREPRR